MKTKNQLIAFLVTAGTSLLAISSASAQSGTWLGNGSAWNDTAAWSGGTIADGSGNTANFTGVDLAADVSMSLGANRTIGSIIFPDVPSATRSARPSPRSKLPNPNHTTDRHGTGPIVPPSTNSDSVPL